MTTEKLRQLYAGYTGRQPVSVSAFPSSGSNRRYFRLAGEPTLVGVCGESTDENRTFIYLSQHFHQLGLPVPQVRACSDDATLYLQDDLGDTLLFDAIASGRSSGVFAPHEVELLKKTIRRLPDVQCRGAQGLDFSRCYSAGGFDRRSIMWDLNYFKYCFLKSTGADFKEDLLEDDFSRMADTLLCGEPSTFMYRDFQSRNVMIKEGEPWFIDFQGGRRGPVHYDVASFLWQAKANFPDHLRRELLDEYINALQRYQPVCRPLFMEQLRHFILFRTLQVLGAYGFRGYFEKKPHFIQSVPFAMANLRQLLAEPYPEYPYLCRLLQTLASMPRYAIPQPSGSQPDGLTVEVTSFSYKKGIPEDSSGNGGGFVFDCRAIHNPGRYERYKTLDGTHPDVIAFLEENGEAGRFLEHVYPLVDASVERYLKRGFTHLCVSFGCTGGQHRSVYCAQHLAEHLHHKYGIRIRLTHRERHTGREYAPCPQEEERI